jgi:hypothetical protein
MSYLQNPPIHTTHIWHSYDLLDLHLHKLYQTPIVLHIAGAAQHKLRRTTPHEAVFAAYGWKSALDDEENLEKLLALNLERAKALQ